MEVKQALEVVFKGKKYYGDGLEGMDANALFFELFLMKNEEKHSIGIFPSSGLDAPIRRVNVEGSEEPSTNTPSDPSSPDGQSDTT